MGKFLYQTILDDIIIFLFFTKNIIFLIDLFDS